MERHYNNEPFSYGGKYRLFDHFDKAKVNDIISKSDIYTRFKQHEKPKTYSPIYVYRRCELFQSDLYFLQIIIW